MHTNKQGTRRGRKIAAGALLILGLSGATAAAAAQLNLSWTGSFQAGSTSVTADCQTSGTITSSFDTPTFSGTSSLPWAVANVKFAGVASTCGGLKYEVAYKTTGDWVQLGTTATVPTNGGTISAALGSVDPQTITKLALTIYS
jgi:hypothetical protein